MPHTYTLQDQLQVPYLIKALRWDETVANDLLTTLDCIQLTSGFVTPIMEDTTILIEYVDQGLLISLRERLSDINANLGIEKAWAPKLQHHGDESLMERFSCIDGVTTGQLKSANAVRLYLRVITILSRPHPPRWEIHPSGCPWRTMASRVQPGMAPPNLPTTTKLGDVPTPRQIGILLAGPTLPESESQPRP